MGRHVKRTIEILCCAILLLTVCQQVHAEGNHKKVRVGYVIQEGYQERRGSGYKTGYGYEYLQRIAYETGWEYEYIYGAFSELLQALKDGKIDLMGNISYTEERSKEILYTELEQSRESYYLYVLDQEEEIQPGDSDAMNSLTIGVTENSFQDGLLMNWLEEKGYTSEVKKYSGSVKLLEAIDMGEVDSFVMPELHSTEFSYSPIGCIGFSPCYFGVSKKRPDLLEELNDALQVIQSANPSINESLRLSYITSSLTSIALTQSDKSWLQEHDYTIRFGFFRDNLPYISIKKNGELRGVIPEILKVLENEYGITTQVTAFDTIEEFEEALKSKEFDVYGPLFGDFWLAEKYGINITDSMFSTPLLLLHKEKNLNKAMKSIAYATNNIIQTGIIQSLYPDAKTVACTDLEECLKAVERGEAGSTLITSISLNIYKRLESFHTLQTTQITTNHEICLGVVSGKKEPRDIVNRAIYRAKDNMQGAALSEAIYAEQPISFKTLLDAYWGVIMIFLLLVVLVAVFLILYYRSVIRQMKKMRETNHILHMQAFRDEMTKVGNRAAYLEKEKILDDLIKKREISKLAVVVIDINGLKWVNDQFGHESGDLLIQNACSCLCRIFSHSPVYRMGGDEFAVILEGRDFESRMQLIEQFQVVSSKDCLDMDDLVNGKFSAAFGMAEFEDGKDMNIQQVHIRADHIMYEYKKVMKKNLSSCMIRH